MEQLEKFLIQIGLSEKESKIYLFLLTVDEANVSEISKKTKINRTTVYPVVDSLEEKGLVQEINKNSKSFIQALSPEKIETYIENEKIRLYEQSKMVKNIIPEFRAISRGLGERPIVEYYEGKEEILKSAKEMIMADSKEDMYVIYPRDEIEKNFTSKELEPVRNERIKRDIKINSIYTYSKGEYSPEKTKNRIRLNPKKYPIKAEIGVFGNNIRIHIFGKNPGTIFIRSEDAAQTLKTLFKIGFK